LIEGRTYISDKELCFSGRTETLLVVIRLEDIVSIQTVTSRILYESGVKKALFDAVSPGHKPNALHIFTRDNMLHQFISPAVFEFWYGVVDYAWRVRLGLPLPA